MFCFVLLLLLPIATTTHLFPTRFIIQIIFTALELGKTDEIRIAIDLNVLQLKNV